MGGVLRDLGPCSVTFNSVDLGPAYGDIVVRFNMEDKPIYENSKGIAEVDSVLVGAKMEIEVPLSRSTLAQLNAVVPSSTISNNKMTVNSPVGVSMYDSAAELILKPLVGGVAGANTSWITVPHASPKADFEIVYNNENQRVYKVVFKCFADPTTGKIYHIGA